MTRTIGGTVGATAATALAFPTVALALSPVGGTFTSTQADIHVAKGSARVVNAQINCKLRRGVTIEEIEFQQPIKVQRSGSFAFRGTAFYISAANHRSKMTTASISGRFTTSKSVQGSVKGGPGACRSVRFAATYNPQAH